MKEELFQAVDYIEEHLTDRLELKKIASHIGYSEYHFLRMFGLMFGLPCKEYVFKRKMSVAGRLLVGGEKVTCVAFSLGYESIEGFARAFKRFHGISPSKAKYSTLHYFPRIDRNKPIKEDDNMFYEVKQYPDFELIGFSKRFSGYPFGDERNKRENDFFSSTRAKQWLLIGASSERENDYEIITAGENSKSYDFFIGYKVDEWTKKALFDQTITGVDLSPFEFFIRKIRGGLYATFKVSGASVIRNYQFLREEIASCFDGEFSFVPGPEIVIYHWRCDKDQRSIEVRLPVNKG